MSIPNNMKHGPLVLSIPGGGHRLIDQVFAAPGGIVVVEAGWSDPLRSHHADHFIEGEVFEEPGGWRIGDFYLWPLEDDDEEHLRVAWIEWEQIMKGKPKAARRKAAADYVRRDLEIDVEI